MNCSKSVASNPNYSKQLFRLLKDTNGVYEGFFCYEGRYIKEKVVLENTFQVKQGPGENNTNVFKK